MNNYGLNTDLIRDFEEYILGQAKIPFIPFNESGDWSDSLPRYESQTTRLGQETSACTAYGALSQIECLHKFLYKDEPNYSERYTYNLVPITPGYGTDPQKTYETIRRTGVVDERDLPMTDSLAEYADRSKVTGSLLAKGQNWLLNHDFRHEWLWKSNAERPANYIEILKDTLQTSPIGVSVTAWRKEGDVYVSDSGGNNHWVVLYKIDDEGYPWIFDTYDHSLKKLAKDHNIRRAKRIWLQKKTKKEMRSLIALLQLVVKRLTMKPSLVDIARKYLGTDASPSDKAPDELGCSESVTTILKSLYPETPIILGTWTLWFYLRDPKNGWVEIPEYEEGAVVISPTGTGEGTGHTGICMGENIIASNNSFGVFKGKFTENYTTELWNRRYKEKQGMPVLYFKHV